MGFLDNNVKKNTANSIKTNLGGSKKLQAGSCHSNATSRPVV